MTSMLPYIITVWLFLIGLYGIVTSRNTIHLVSCLFVVQSSTYILLIFAGYRRGASAPILDPSRPELSFVDPVVQSLVLTDIVVGAAVSALILIFAVQAHKRSGSTDPGSIRPMRG